MRKAKKKKKRFSTSDSHGLANTTSHFAANSATLELPFEGSQFLTVASNWRWREQVQIQTCQCPEVPLGEQSDETREIMGIDISTDQLPQLCRRSVRCETGGKMYGNR